MLLLLAPLLMMKIRVGDSWTVVYSKKTKNSLNGKKDFGKGGFFNSGKEKGREKEKRKNSAGKAKISKKHFFKEIEVCALAQSR